MSRTRTTSTQLDTIDVVYQDGKSEVLTLTPREMAGFKRSAKWKTRVTVKKICSITTTVKTYQ